jgi:hypothetical protein
MIEFARTQLPVADQIDIMKGAIPGATSGVTRRTSPVLRVVAHYRQQEEACG